MLLYTSFNNQADGYIPEVPQVPEGDLIFIVAGGANAIAFGTTGSDVPVELQAVDTDVHIWNTHTQAWESYEAGVNSDTWNSGASTPQKWGPEAEFARQFRIAHPTVPVYIVKVAVDMSSLGTQGGEDWNPANSELFADLQTELDAAKAELADPVVAALLWMHGEQDAEDVTNSADYGGNLSTFITAVRSNWGADYTRILIGRITSHADWDFASSVRALQLKVGRDENTATCISTDSYSLTVSPDTRHYDADGVVDLGADMYAAYAETYPLLIPAWERNDQHTEVEISLSNSNKTAEGTGANSSDFQVVRADALLDGKIYWEIEIDGAVGNILVGAARGVISTYTGSTSTSIGYAANGQVFSNGAVVTTYASYTTGDRVNVAFDSATGKIWFGKNGTFNGDPTAGTGQAATLPTAAFPTLYRPAATLRRSGDIVTCAFGAADFTDSPPSDFSAI